MTASLPQCPRCQTLLPAQMANIRDLASCPNCGRQLELHVYPAQFRRSQTATAGEAVIIEGEASCFYHPQKRASVPCESCGRFLCALCDIDMAGKHLCPACIDSGQKKGKLTQLENKRMLWDSSALAMALVPILMWPFTLFTAPAAIILGIIAWNKPSSVVQRTRARIYLAILIATAQLVAWAIFGLNLFKEVNR